MNIAIMTDSTSYIPSDIRKSLNIKMLPLNVVIGDETYAEEVDISAVDFYDKVKQEEELPKTSQPSIGYIENEYQKLASEYDAVISIHLSSGISGTYQAAISAGAIVEGINVYGYDSEISCMAQGFYVLKAAQMAQSNHTVNEILSELDRMKQSLRAYFMVDDLSHLQRGGRLNGAQAFVGSLLKVKPILHFVDKIIVPFEKIRTRKKALNRILQLLSQDTTKGGEYKVVVIHANRKELASELCEQIINEHKNVECSISYFGPVIGTHLGEGSIGIGWYKES